jgi:uroporphyrin-III C-methyltransferase / precorrin-2 dehydrogenase / sirohydrochlorin ferrochelatase
MHSLPLFMRLESRPVILLGEGEAADAKRRLLERARAVIVGESETASLAIVAMDDEAEALAAIARLKKRGVLVNAVDRPDHCDFTLPAIVDRDPVLIAIGTGGASAGLAKALRQRLEGMLPESLGSLANGLQQARAMLRSRWPEPIIRRLAIDAALDIGGPLDPFSNHSEAAVSDWLADGEGRAVYAVHQLVLRSDDPDDLTFKEARLLGKADCIVHAPRIPRAILNRARADAKRIAGFEPPHPLPLGLTVIIRRG